MRRCLKCVETDTRPTTHFDEEGICRPCRNVSHESIANIDWSFRSTQLQEVIKWGKEHAGSGYDCIIGVSGGKDSTRQAIHARKIGLNPLLVSCTYPPEQMTDLGAENLSNLIELGFDTIVVSPAPGTSKELMLNCFKTYGNLFNASELALYASLPIVAITYKIPLILLGENPGLSFGTDVGSNDYNGNAMKHMNTLQGGDPRHFKTKSIKDSELYWYRYPSDESMEKADLRIVYLGYFIPDFNDHTNVKIATENGMKVRSEEDAKPENIGGLANYVALDDDFVIVNQMLKYMKFGFGKATQEIGVAIRSGLMDRKEGISIVNLYDGKCHPKYIHRLANYLQISVEEFWKIAESYRNKELFTVVNGEWKLRQELCV